MHSCVDEIIDLEISPWANYNKFDGQIKYVIYYWNALIAMMDRQ